MLYSESVWQKLVIDAKTRGCFFDAEEDDGLACAIAFALLELGQPDGLLHVNSLLFRRSRWKVCSLAYQSCSLFSYHVG